MGAIGFVWESTGIAQAAASAFEHHPPSSFASGDHFHDHFHDHVHDREKHAHAASEEDALADLEPVAPYRGGMLVKTHRQGKKTTKLFTQVAFNWEFLLLAFACPRLWLPSIILSLVGEHQ